MMDLGTDEEEDGSGDGDFDPMAFYRQQQQEMLQEASQHVQESQEEIQQAQHLAASLQQESPQEEETGMGRRRRRAAAQATQNLHMMSEDQEQIDRVVFDRPTATPGIGGGGRGRGRSRGRGRPPGTTAAVMAARRAAVPGYERDFETVRRGRPPRQVRSTEIQPEDESSLYFIIRNGKASLQQVVDDWIDSYKVGRKGKCQPER